MPIRYAIYYAPRQGSDLDTFGRRWFGRDLAGEPVGDRVAVPELSSAYLDRLVEKPRTYGFHATLKPPFVLRTEAQPDQLRASLAAFASTRRCVQAPPLALTTLGRFIALIPNRPAPPLDRLARACVMAFDRFRAPPSRCELAGRRSVTLSRSQEMLLKRWGYPYVLEEFRFHMTLSAAVADAKERAAILTSLQPAVAPLCRDPLAVTDICLFRQDHEAELFTLDQRFDFGADREPRESDLRERP